MFKFDIGCFVEDWDIIVEEFECVIWYVELMLRFFLFWCLL